MSRLGERENCKGDIFGALYRRTRRGVALCSLFTCSHDDRSSADSWDRLIRLLLHGKSLTTHLTSSYIRIVGTAREMKERNLLLLLVGVTTRECLFYTIHLRSKPSKYTRVFCHPLMAIRITQSIFAHEWIFLKIILLLFLFNIYINNNILNRKEKSCCCNYIFYYLIQSFVTFKRLFNLAQCPLNEPPLNDEREFCI